jgi:2-polyprenyl-3-methyl-5-hydroxy-6-metoxy-1,4-benzoquinol methylase
MIGRWYLCPMQKLASYVPQTGAIMDLGCGHGMFTQLLARESNQREVIGVDLDARKIEIARQVSLPNLRFILGDVADVDLPPVQAVTILDVFYLIPYEVQERLLAAAAARLAPDGVIVLKEMAETPRWKVRLNWLEETLAVKILHITQGSEFYFRPCADWQKLLGDLGFQVETIPLDHGYYHPHIVFIGRKL